MSEWLIRSYGGAEDIFRCYLVNIKRLIPYEATITDSSNPPSSIMIYTYDLARSNAPPEDLGANSTLTELLRSIYIYAPITQLQV